MNFDVITIGTLVQNILLVGREDFENGSVEDPFCFAPGSKTQYRDMYGEIGGQAANIAVSLARLGLKSALVAKVGKDNIGKQLVKELKEKKVSVTLIKQDLQHQTGCCVMVNGVKGEKMTLIHRGAAHKLQISDIPLSKLKSKWVCISSQDGDVALLSRIAESAQKKNAKVAFMPGQKELDQGLRDLLPVLRQVDLLALNREEAEQLTGYRDVDMDVLIEAIGVATPGMIVVMDGSRGSYLTPRVDNQSTIYFAPATNDNLIEQTGAEDAFLAGLIAGLTTDYDNIEQAMQLATVNAASALSDYGAQRGLLKRFPSKSALNQVRVTPI